MTEQTRTTDVPLHSHRGLFIAVFAMLCALTGISFWIANSHLMDNLTVGWSAMMAVSVAKAFLVVMFFMHLWWERAWKYALVVPSVIMGALLTILLVPDVAFRTNSYSKQRQAASPAPVVSSENSTSPGDDVSTREASPATESTY